MAVNSLALAALLEAEDGPVGREIRRRAEAIADLARFNAGFILQRMEGTATLEDVLSHIDYEQEGVIAEVGIRDEGKIENYLAAKENREQNILRPAVEVVFGDVPLKIVF